MSGARGDDLLRLVEPWVTEEGACLLTTRIFAVRERRSASRTHPHKRGAFVYLDTCDWVNVIALTELGEVVLIEQFRQGTQEVTLEIPGGMLEPGEDPVEAGLRELLEESGFSGGRAELIGSVTPNPAIQSNRCHTLLVQGVSCTSAPALDGNEEIAVRLAPLAGVPGLIRDGTIHHALVIAAFHHLSLLER